MTKINGHFHVFADPGSSAHMVGCPVTWPSELRESQDVSRCPKVMALSWVMPFPFFWSKGTRLEPGAKLGRGVPKMPRVDDSLACVNIQDRSVYSSEVSDVGVAEKT